MRKELCEAGGGDRVRVAGIVEFRWTADLKLRVLTGAFSKVQCRPHAL